MNIQELIAQGQKRKAEAERQSAENARLQEQAAITKHAAEWQPILQEVAKFLPPELAHILVTPEHSSTVNEGGGYYRKAKFIIRIPDTKIHILCDPDPSLQYYANGPTFQAMTPEIYWDESGYDGFCISWCRTGGERGDFLIALSEAAAYADTLPTIQAKADRKNAEWLAKESEETTAPEPAPQPVDWLAEAEIYYTQSENSANTAALIAIGQELRKLSRAITPLSYGGYALNVYDNSRPQ